MKSSDAAPVRGAVCVSCVEARMTRDSFTDQEEAELESLEIMYVDLAGPVTPQSKGGANHVLTTKDGRTGLVVIGLLKAKSEAEAELRAIVNRQ